MGHRSRRASMAAALVLTVAGIVGVVVGDALVCVILAGVGGAWLALAATAPAPSRPDRAGSTASAR